MGKQLVVLNEKGRTKVAVFQDNRLFDLHVENEGEALVGNIYCGQVTRVLPSIPGAFVDFGGKKDGFLPLDSMPLYQIHGKWWKVSVSKFGRDHEIREGQKVLVQVTKEPIEDKGARLTSDISIPGRYLVYMPIAHRGGISRQIDQETERRRLRDMIREITHNVPGAFIIRTVCEGHSRKELEKDCKSLRRLWRDLCRQYTKSDVPRMIHQELGLIHRLLRDIFTTDFDEIVVNSRRIRRQLRGYLKGIGTEGALDKRVKYRTGDQIRTDFRIERHLREALSRKVWLPCGGYLFIDELPAITVIDVNTGKNIRKGDPQKTILQTNLEAAREIPRQLRIRAIGGIIIIDFIDMEPKENKARVLDALQQAMKEDRTAWDIIGYSEISLVQITRKRDRSSLLMQLTDECPHCHGEGRIPKD